MESKRIILLSGPPGAGKGTQAGLLAARHGWHTFSVGELLRESADARTQAVMDAGDLLPAEEVVGLVMSQIIQSPTSVLVDGFPRQLDQAVAFDAGIKQGGLPPVLVLHLCIGEEESWRRLSLRGRVDDEREVWQQRWERYRLETLPAISHYRASGNLVEIDGEGDVNSVAKRMEAAVHES